MKSLKRAAAVFMAAIMLIVCLAGCGGSGESGSSYKDVSDLAKEVREITETSQNTNLDNVASFLSRKQEVTVESVTAALTENYWSDNTIYLVEDHSAEVADFADSLIIASAATPTSDTDADYNLTNFFTVSDYSEAQLKYWAGTVFKEQIPYIKADFIQYFYDTVTPALDEIAEQTGDSIVATIDEDTVDVSLALGSLGTYEYLIALDISYAVEIVVS